jgi:hypothetical protein
MTAAVEPSSWPDWPQGGCIRPLLSTRVEWAAKGFARTLRRRSGPSTLPEFDLEPVYRHAMSRHPAAPCEALRQAFRNAVQRSQQVDATFAALAVAVAAGDRPRTEGLTAFLQLCYGPADLEASTARMGTCLHEASVDPGSTLARLDVSSFAALSMSVRDSLPPQWAPRRERRLPVAGPKSVVVRISGGLGNQLFQYAAALGYARRIGAPLRLDLVEYESADRHRDFQLGRLRVPVRRTSSLEVVRLRLRPHRETRGQFDDFLFGDHGSAWLRGFWEDDAYFADILPTLRRRFQPRDESIAAAAREMVERARTGDGPVIGVHLRRGDRGPGGNAFAPFSSLPASYYQLAANRFPTGANFLVFSDSPGDIAWCREHLGLGEGATVSFGDGRDPILDMFALAGCDHVILSSGTFSWWAGYLGERPGRRVIAPNPLQGLSAERVMIPWPMPLQPGWEEVTLESGLG